MKISISVAFVTGLATFLFIIVMMLLSFSYISSENMLRSYLHEAINKKSAVVIERIKRDLFLAQSSVEMTVNQFSVGRLSLHDSKFLEHSLYQQILLLPSFSGAYIGVDNGDFVYVKRGKWKVAGEFITFRITHKRGHRFVNKTWRNDKFEIIKQEDNVKLAYDPRTRPWYRKAIETRQTIWTDPYLFNSSRKPGITVASPGYLSHGMKSIVVGIDLDIYGISDLLRNLGEGTSSFIISKKGKVIASSSFSDSTFPSRKKKDDLPSIYDLQDPVIQQSIASLSTPLEKILLMGHEFFSFSIKGEKYYALFSHLNNPNWPWIIGLNLSEESLLGELMEKRNKYLIYSFLFAILLVALATWLAHTMVRPIKALSQISSSIRKDGFGVDPRVFTRYLELQKLANDFADLMKELYNREQDNLHLTQKLNQLNVDLEKRVYDRTKELHDANKQLEEVAATDALTGLSNRRRLDQTISHELSRASRYSHQCSLIMFDIDHFKSVNDTFGHQIGDDVLVGIAELVKLNIRNADLAGRWGGEEFLIVCSDTDLAAAKTVAEKLRRAVKKHSFPTAGVITASFGVTEFIEGDDAIRMTKRVDEMCYKAKNNGRNRVEW
ncbi:MAG: diguanylate cyclase [Mariprofundaceae bacterium]|nr:diguanylate cyclase [Mariprofundaceae bacterium]